MTEKLSLRLSEIKALDHDTLARLVSKEARFNKPFKKAIKAVLLVQKNGIDDLIKIITLECDALNTNTDTKFIPLEKLSGFRKNLRQLSDSICNDLAQLSPQKAAIHLIAFIHTHEEVFQYVEGPGFVIDDFYDKTLEKLRPIVLKLSEDERDKLLELIIQNFKDSTAPFFEQALNIVCSILEPATLRNWDQRLQALYQSGLANKNRNSDDFIDARYIDHDPFDLRYILEGRTIIALTLQEKLRKMGVQENNLDN